MDAEAQTDEHEHEHDHDHDEHDHDGHEHGGHEHDEVDEAQAEADVARMAAALAAIEDDVLRNALEQMSEKSRLDVAAQLQMPRATMRLGDALVPLVRRKVRSAAPDHQLQVLFALAENVNDETIETLGDNAGDPTLEDLQAVLPPIVEKYPRALVTAMLAGYAASDAPCRPVMRELLDTDERFVIGPAIEVDDKASTLFAPPPVVDKEELAAKREARRAAKDAKRAAELREKEAKKTAEVKRREAVHQSKRKGR
jgi:hypothetical protein